MYSYTLHRLRALSYASLSRGEVLCLTHDNFAFFPPYISVVLKTKKKKGKKQETKFTRDTYTHSVALYRRRGYFHDSRRLTQRADKVESNLHAPQNFLIFFLDHSADGVSQISPPLNVYSQYIYGDKHLHRKA